MPSLKLIDGLKEQEVYASLREILPDEASDRRRITRLESYVCERAANDRDWAVQYAASKDSSMEDNFLDEYERKAYCISPALLYQFALHVRNEKYWSKHAKTPENQERRMMDAWPGRFDARSSQNRGRRSSATAMGALHDRVADWMGFQDGRCSAKDLYDELFNLLQWRIEFEDGDRVVEVKDYEGSAESLDMVIRKANGEVWGEPTKTFEQIAEESVIARSRKTGVSGRPLDLSDPFLGLLKQP